VQQHYGEASSLKDAIEAAAKAAAGADASAAAGSR
jgi:hypothetical protein